SLTLNNGARVSEVVWDGLTKNMCGSGTPCATGSGCSALVPKPSWQKDVGCKKRSATDVSANADPYTGVVIACTPCVPKGQSPLFAGEGGTSESSPLMGGMFGLAGNASTYTPAMLWGFKGKGFYDITSGTNAKKGVTGLVCPAAYSYICTARAGYDGPTGWGTPNGVSSL
ncbi:MAG: hypothetical protein JO199_13340, partial [Candidatus Eremiobacteraeota bacterium]|nr:hypothetical protein [Candidatus Eremiobacteraeota bacterium]